MALYHVFDQVTNRRTGVPMMGVQVRVRFDDTDTDAPIYADQDGELFEPDNYCVTDADGMFSFYVNPGEYKLEFLVGSEVIKVIDDFRPAEVGPSGPANSSYATTSELESANVGNLSAILAEAGKAGTFTVRAYDEFVPEVAADTGKVNFIQSVSDPTKVWVRASFLSEGASRVGTASGSDVETELSAKAAALGISATATNLGDFGSIIPDDSNVKVALIALEDALATVEGEVETITRRLPPVNRKMELIAHRGFVDQGPQNTILAMSCALASGADSLECDVQVSSDGSLYLFHDTTVQALTDGTGTFTALSSSYINGLKFDALVGTRFADEGIPTFAEFLKFAKTAGVYIYPEIKGYRTQADIALMVSAVQAAGMADQCMFQSFNFTDLEYVRTITADIQVGYLVAGSTAAIDQIALLGSAALLASYTSILANPSLVSYCGDKGVGLAVWTVPDRTTARNLMKIGVNRQMANINLKGLVNAY